jgi:hypothetical protein
MTSKSESRKQRWVQWASSPFTGQAVAQSVKTIVHIHADPKDVWNRIVFYEEVPGRPPLLLRFFLPCPVRTEGDKLLLDGKVRCIYRGGDLVKQITAVEPPHTLKFEVAEQRLGIEKCMQALGGSYEIRRCRDGADAILTTNYLAYLHPRRLWYPLEQMLTSRLHRHILGGIEATLPCAPAAIWSPGAERLRGQTDASGQLSCLAAPFRFHP